MVFSRVKSVLKKFVDNIVEVVATKTITEDEIAPLLDELTIELVESDVALDVAEEITGRLKSALIGVKVSRTTDVREYVRAELYKAIVDILMKGYRDIDLVSEAKSRSPQNPLKIVFFGVNGVGKTTTIAKFAYMFKEAGVTPVIVAADTFRAGAQEQLRKHAEKIGVPFVGGRYNVDPASIVYDGIEYAKARGYKVVLIDTAGRMHTDSDLMNELRKIVKVSKPDYKVLIIDSLTGNDAVEQARLFNESIGMDFIVLTKVDADTKGGVAISVASVTGKPILFMGVGQGYKDLEKFTPEAYARKILE